MPLVVVGYQSAGRALLVWVSFGTSVALSECCISPPSRKGYEVGRCDPPLMTATRVTSYDSDDIAECSRTLWPYFELL